MKVSLCNAFVVCVFMRLSYMPLGDTSVYPSKNHLARNIQILQVFFLQDLQDLVLNLASLALKMKLFLQELKNLARILQEKIVR